MQKDQTYHSYYPHVYPQNNRQNKQQHKQQHKQTTRTAKTIPNSNSVPNFVSPQIRAPICPKIHPYMKIQHYSSDEIVIECINLDELMEFIYTDMRTLMFGPSVLSDTYKCMDTEISISHVDMPEFRQFVIETICSTPDTIISQPSSEVITSNLHGQTLLMLSVLLNIQFKNINDLFAVDDFGMSALDYSSKLGAMNGYIAIIPDEIDNVDDCAETYYKYSVVFRKFNDISKQRYEQIREWIEQYEYTENSNI